MIPYKLVKKMHISENTKTQRLVRKKRSLFNKWRQHKRIQDKKSVNSLNKDIRKSIYETKKQNVRRKIKPGNSKTLLPIL